MADAEAEATPEPPAAKPGAQQAWLEAFLGSNCIQLVFESVQRSLLTPGQDLAFYRELANLMVLMLSSTMHLHASGATSSQDLSDAGGARGRQPDGAEASSPSPGQPASSRESGEAGAGPAPGPEGSGGVGAGAAGALSRRGSAAGAAPEAMRLDLGGDLVKDCVSMLLVLCLRACGFWGLPQASRAGLGGGGPGGLLERNPELAIIKDILSLLSKLHDTFPDTVELLQVRGGAAGAAGGRCRVQWARWCSGRPAARAWRRLQPLVRCKRHLGRPQLPDAPIPGSCALCSRSTRLRRS